MMRAAALVNLAAAGALVWVAAGACGCKSDPRALAGYSLVIPEGWSPWSGPPPVVPGEVLEAHRVPCAAAEGSLVVFRSAYLPETTVSQLLIQRRYLLTNLPSFQIRGAREIEVSGKPALIFDLTAQGTGNALSATGLGKPIPPPGETQIPTRRLWVSVPRGPEQGTLEVFFHSPEADYERLRPEWEAVLKSLRA